VFLDGFLRWEGRSCGGRGRRRGVGGCRHVEREMGGLEGMAVEGSKEGRNSKELSFHFSRRRSGS